MFRFVLLHPHRLATALIAALALPAVHVAAAASTPQPQAITVANCNDSGTGSLRAAIASVTGANHVVDLSGLACSTITLTTGALVTTAIDLTLLGPADHHLTIDGGYSGQPHRYNNAINHFGGGTLELDDLIVADAKYQGTGGQGGCIWSAGNVTLLRSQVNNCSIVNSSDSGNAMGAGIFATGDVTLRDSRVTGNLAASENAMAFGGGIYSKGSLLVFTSTIADNIASGGIASEGGGIIALDGIGMLMSTVSGNSATFGGGVFVDNTTAVATDSLISTSTLSGNKSTSAGSALFARISTSLYSDTIAFNTSTGTNVAGVYLEGTPHIESTIIVANTANGSNFDLDAPANTTSTGNNNMMQAYAHILMPPASVAGGSATDLLPLADNGGLTRTHALRPGSYAIDHGGAATTGFDQRGPGFLRTRGGVLDIGAFEVDSDIIFVNGFN